MTRSPSELAWLGENYTLQTPDKLHARFTFLLHLVNKTKFCVFSICTALQWSCWQVFPENCHLKLVLSDVSQHVISSEYGYDLKSYFIESILVSNEWQNNTLKLYAQIATPK